MLSAPYMRVPAAQPIPPTFGGRRRLAAHKDEPLLLEVLLEIPRNFGKLTPLNTHPGYLNPVWRHQMHLSPHVLHRSRW